jgi:hypothetical protein
VVLDGGSPPRRSRRGQSDGEWVTAQNHERWMASIPVREPRPCVFRPGGWGFFVPDALGALYGLPARGLAMACSYRGQMRPAPKLMNNPENRQSATPRRAPLWHPAPRAPGAGHSGPRRLHWRSGNFWASSGVGCQKSCTLSGLAVIAGPLSYRLNPNTPTSLGDADIGTFIALRRRYLFAPPRTFAHIQQ